MRCMHKAIIIIGCSLFSQNGVAANEDSVARNKALGAEYRICMTRQVKHFAKKTDNPEYAIAAAKHKCKAVRDKIQAFAFVDLMEKGVSAQNAEATSLKVMNQVDALFRDELISIALDVKK